MIVVNYEADELLMNICMKVKVVKYYAVFPKGTKYHLTDKYRQNGRFNRKSVEMYFTKKNLTLDKNYTIVAEESYEGKEKLAMFLIQKQIRKVYHATKADVIHFWLGPEDKSNFRFKSAVTEPYKSDRGEKPEILQILRDWLILTQGAQVAYGYEADDMLGLHQKQDYSIAHTKEWSDVNEFGVVEGKLSHAVITEGTIACHQDKDINQISGWHYNWAKDEMWYCGELGDLQLTDKKEIKGCGLAWFYAQLLLGDRTDTIPSLQKGKYGAVGVYNLLQHCKAESDYLEVVVNEYKKVIGSEWLKRLQEQADLVWICRKEGEYGSSYIDSKLMEYYQE